VRLAEDADLRTFLEERISETYDSLRRLDLVSGGEAALERVREARVLSDLIEDIAADGLQAAREFERGREPEHRGAFTNRDSGDT